MTHTQERERERDTKRERVREREIQRVRLASFLAAWAFDALVDSSYELLTVVHRIHKREKERERERERDNDKKNRFI